jgi:hypothetical protein
MTPARRERCPFASEGCDNRNFRAPRRMVMATRKGERQMRGIRERLSYANVMATLAVFIALGGTSYALTLPRNSVGSGQLKSRSVGNSEIKGSAVTSTKVRARSLRLSDLSHSARAALRGQAGPPGPAGPSGVSLFAAVNAIGQVVRPTTGVSSFGHGLNGRVIGFLRSVSACVATATLATVPGANPASPPPTGHVTVSHTSDGRVLVQTWAANGSATFIPFHLAVAC